MRNKRPVDWSILIPIAFIFVVIALVVGVSYPMVDAKICVARIARKINVESDMGAIKTYIENKLSPGMTRNSVYKTLEEIAPIVVSKYYAPTGMIREQVVIKMCSFSLNNLVYIIDYSLDGKLSSDRIYTR